MGQKIGKWIVKYRSHDGVEWRTLEGAPGYWYADPLLFHWGGQTYLFTEAYEERKQIGRLAVSEYGNGRFSIPEIIIKKSYHLSYPCVFHYDGKPYMIPETSQNKTLELYEGSTDLKKWDKKKNLLDGIRLVDSTVIERNGELYIYSYSDFGGKYISYLFGLDMANQTARLLKRKEWTSNCHRPAGKAIISDGEMFMPFQRNVRCYGGQMLIRKFSDMNDLFIEEPSIDLTPEMLKGQRGMENDILRTHTLSYDGNLEILDVLRDFPDPWAVVKGYRRRFRNLFYKIAKKENNEYRVGKISE